MPSARAPFPPYAEVAKLGPASLATADHQFFLSVGQTWCAKYRPEMAKMLARVDTHSPPRFRLQGPLSNMPEFAAAFSCPASAPMQAKTACAVW